MELDPRIATWRSGGWRRWPARLHGASTTERP